MTSGGFVCPRCDLVHSSGEVARCRRCGFSADDAPTERRSSVPSTPSASFARPQPKPLPAPSPLLEPTRDTSASRFLVDPESGMLRTYLVVPLIALCVAATLFVRVVRMHDEAVEDARTSTGGEPDSR